MRVLEWLANFLVPRHEVCICCKKPVGADGSKNPPHCWKCDARE